MDYPTATGLFMINPQLRVGMMFMRAVCTLLHRNVLFLHLEDFTKLQ